MFPKILTQTCNTKVKILSEDLQVTTPSILPGFESQPNNRETFVYENYKIFLCF